MEDQNMSVRARPRRSISSSSSKHASILVPADDHQKSSSSSTSDHDDDHDERMPIIITPPPPPKSLSQRAISQTLTTTANLANLLPTGTVLAFQLLTPIFSNNGACGSSAVTRTATLLLLSLLAISCFLASFTDSVKSSRDGRLYYGFATSKGLFLFDGPTTGSSTTDGLPDLTKYKIRFVDWIHSVLSVLVFVSVALRDKNVLSCFYPLPKQETQQLLNIAPLGIGLICSLLFSVFPTRRHGIGYPLTSARSN